MKELHIKATFEVFEDFDELPTAIKNLMQAAAEARNKAYAPYSKFSVGAAIRLENGEIITGSNQENASYPSGLCAERTAIYYAGAKFPESNILQMAIIAGSQKRKTTKPVPPCGACRQAIAEYETKQSRPIELYFMGESGEVIKSNSLANLLPLIFDKNNL